MARQDNTLLATPRRMGYDKDLDDRPWFRLIASTILHEQGGTSDIIERQLAHAERNSMKAATMNSTFPAVEDDAHGVIIWIN